jgi:hypothetical protein
MTASRPGPDKERATELFEERVGIPHVRLVIVPPRVLARFLILRQPEDLFDRRERGGAIAVRARQKAESQVW